MGPDNKKITLVDDEENILTLVSLALRTEGYDVYSYKNGEDALIGLENNPSDLAILDIKMPRMNGRELLNKIRMSKNIDLKNIPIIFLTSKDDEQDEIIGLKMGAADYITKPFSQKLLLERIKTVLRVHNNRMQKNYDSSETTLLKGNLILDEAKQLCFWKKNEVELTVAEFKLIECIAKQPGVLKDRNQIMDAMYGERIYVHDRTIDSHIKRLRRKFKTVDKSFNHIHTRYGLGYSWRE